MSTPYNISFVIPAYNEQEALPRALKSIQDHGNPVLNAEVIVVDNGSTDDTVDVARQQSAKVYVKSSGTIASLRNFGVEHAAGEILIFLDADVILTETWRAHIVDTINKLRENGNVVTGSWYGVPEDMSWIERFWFQPLTRGDNTHINSGHLIIRRDLFDRLGGFSEHLETGEDYDFSMRAKAAGIQILDNPDLLVIHEGYPKTLGVFISREIWHGKGDYVSFSTIVRSKIAIASLAFLVLHVLVITGIVARFNWLGIVAGIVLIALLSLGASYAKYRDQTMLHIFVNAFLYYWYFWARALAFLKSLISRSVGKHEKRRKILER